MLRTYLSVHFRKARKQLGLTQDQLALKLGVTPSAISRYENGNRRPPKYVLNRLKVLLGGTADQTLARVVQQSQEPPEM